MYGIICNMSNVQLVSSTQINGSYLLSLITDASDEKFLGEIQTSEGLMAYCARVSSPQQTKGGSKKLLRYCIDHKHWSVFEMVDCTFEIETSMVIAQQLLRHRSFCFQQFSQRYAEVDNLNFETYEARSQDSKNRQNSNDDMTVEEKEWFNEAQHHAAVFCFSVYKEALERGIAKEQARVVLPGNTRTKLYMKGSLRSWIHYVELRSGNGTQKEHQDIANQIKSILCKQYRVIAEALGWIE